MFPVLLAFLLSTSALASPLVPTWLETAAPTTMNPLYAVTPTDVRVQALVYDSLFRWRPGEGWVSDIVASSALEADGRFRIELARGIRWHDGQRLRGVDVCRTLDLLAYLPDSPVTRRMAGRAVRCEVDPGALHIVRVTFDERPIPDPRGALAIPILPAHLDNGHDLATEPVGTGPMRAERWGDSWRFRAVDGGSRRSGLSGLRLKVEPDRGEYPRLLRNGTADGAIGLWPYDLPQVRELPSQRLHFYPQRTWWYIALNTASAPLNDPRVRAALDFSLDREVLRSTLIGVDPERQRQPCTLLSGPYLRDSPEYNNGVPLPEPDDAQVTALLQEAGAVLERGLWTVDGEPITLRLGVPDILDVDPDAVIDAITRQFGGFVVIGEVLSPAEYLQLWADNGFGERFDLLVDSWAVPGPQDISPLYHTPTRHRGVFNTFGFSSQEVDHLIRDRDRATSELARTLVSRELHAQLADERPHLFLWQLDWWSSWRSDITHLAITPYSYFTDLQTWQVP